VSVTGPSLDGRVVSAGESLEIDLEKRVAQDTKPTPPSNDPAPQPTDDIDDTSPAPSVAPSGPTWQELARGARYDEAWAAVEAVGFDTLCERVSAGEIMALADIARYAGKGDRAPHAYTTVRRRFPGSAEAALAAFTLGRMAFHGGGGYGSAIRWFNVYLQEAPNGPLAREALGRIMEAHHNSGSVAAARATAKQYLTTYPKGPHAPLARQIAGP
jgi:predicted Zn-dependent protease